MDLLDVNNHALITPVKDLSPEDKQEVQVAQAGAKALWSMSQSKKNRDEMRKAGCVRLLARLLKSVHGDVVVPITGTLQQCASEVTDHSVTRVSLYLYVSKLLWQMVHLNSSEDVSIFVTSFAKGAHLIRGIYNQRQKQTHFLKCRV